MIHQHKKGNLYKIRHNPLCFTEAAKRRKYSRSFQFQTSGVIEFSRGIRKHWQDAAILGVTAIFLSACEKQALDIFEPQQKSGEQTALYDSSKAQSISSRDVEMPEVFQKTDMGLWDGRPSFGGLWVAHPDVQEPERVIVRNTTNSKFIVGALFRRERETSGPPFQVSSDAAEALGMLAGAPSQLSVTALRRKDASAKVSGPVPDDKADDVDGL